MAVSVAVKQLKAGSVALGSLWKVVATVTQRCVLHKVPQNSSMVTE